MRNALPYLLIGTGIGGALGLLLAPLPGRRLRAQMKFKASRGLVSAKQSGMEVRDQALDFAQKSSEAFSRQTNGVTAAFEAGKRAYQKTVNA